jgi:hypothetical protein
VGLRSRENEGIIPLDRMTLVFRGSLWDLGVVKTRE